MSKLDTRILNAASAEEFVSNNKNVRWEGWDIVTHVPNDKAFFTDKGRFDCVTGTWGLQYRVGPDSQGNWKVRIGNARKPRN